MSNVEDQANYYKNHRADVCTVDYQAHPVDYLITGLVPYDTADGNVTTPYLK